MLVGWHYMDYYSNAYALNQFLASRGNIVLALNYRSGIGYGLDYREAQNYGATGASEYNDVLAAADYLRAQPDVDGRCARNFSRSAFIGQNTSEPSTALTLAATDPRPSPFGTSPAESASPKNKNFMSSEGGRGNFPRRYDSR